MVGNGCFVNRSVKFKRQSKDGLVHAICGDVEIKQGDIVCYEIPAKSTGASLRLDILRYTMECVYEREETLFPCAFNQDAPSTDVKVFFDYVFSNAKYRREVSDRLALALYSQHRTQAEQHEQNNTVYIFKTLGIFDKCKYYNCDSVSYENGETFLVASKDIGIGDILTRTKSSVTIPSLEQERCQGKGLELFDLTLRLMSKFSVRDVHVFTKALSHRDNAELVRPAGSVFVIRSDLDPDLENRMAKYKMDREMGIATFHAGVERLSKKATDLSQKEKSIKKDEHLEELEEIYKRYNDAFERGL